MALSYIYRYGRKLFTRSSNKYRGKRYGYGRTTYSRANSRTNASAKIYSRKRSRYGKSSSSKNYQKGSRFKFSRNFRSVRQSPINQVGLVGLWAIALNIVWNMRNLGLTFFESLNKSLDLNGDGEQQWYEFTTLQWILIFVVFSMIKGKR